jgi:hypothetical protein
MRMPHAFAASSVFLSASWNPDASAAILALIDASAMPLPPGQGSQFRPRLLDLTPLDLRPGQWFTRFLSGDVILPEPIEKR